MMVAQINVSDETPLTCDLITRGCAVLVKKRHERVRGRARRLCDAYWVSTIGTEGTR